MQLYLDFDGVILNTPKKIEEEMARIKCLCEQKKIASLNDINWHHIINNSSPIKDSLVHLRRLIMEDLYDVKVLTKAVSSEEIIAKRHYISMNIGDHLNVIFVPIEMSKSSLAVTDGAILVDDYTPNLDDWSTAGGLAIKFSDNGKQSEHFRIETLEDLIIHYDEIRHIRAEKLLKLQRKT